MEYIVIDKAVIDAMSCKTTKDVLLKLKQRFFCRRRKITNENRLNACGRVYNGESLDMVARDIGVCTSTLRNWLHTAATIRMIVEQRLSAEAIQKLASELFREDTVGKSSRAKRMEREDKKQINIKKPDTMTSSGGWEISPQNEKDLSDRDDRISSGSSFSPEVIDLTDSYRLQTHGPSFPSNQPIDSNINFIGMKNVSNVTTFEPHQWSKSENYPRSNAVFTNQTKSINRWTLNDDKENDSRSQQSIGAGSSAKFGSVSSRNTQQMSGKRERSSSPVPVLDTSLQTQTNGKYRMLDLPGYSHRLTHIVPSTMLWPFHDLNQSIIDRIARNSQTCAANKNFGF